VNKGVLCDKGSAGIMQHYSPARLKTPRKLIDNNDLAVFDNVVLVFFIQCPSANRVFEVMHILHALFGVARARRRVGRQDAVDLPVVGR